MSLFVAQTLNKQNEHEPLNMPLMFCSISEILFLVFVSVLKFLTIDIDSNTIIFETLLPRYIRKILSIIVLLSFLIVSNGFLNSFYDIDNL